MSIIIKIGDEAESYETATNTLNYWLEHAEYKINLNTITVFPGCSLYKNAVSNGIIKDPVQYIKDGCPQMNNTKMTMEEYADIVKKLTQEYGPVGVWGVNYHTSKIFDSVEELNTDLVYPIDVSQIKQQLTLNTRKVSGPEVIKEKEIRVIVVAIPAYFNQIELQIQYEYPQITKVIDICDLIKTP